MSKLIFQMSIHQIYDSNFVTLLVLKLERLISVNDEQLQNIHFISVTLLVFKLERYSSTNDEHS